MYSDELLAQVRERIGGDTAFLRLTFVPILAQPFVLEWNRIQASGDTTVRRRLQGTTINQLLAGVLAYEDAWDADNSGNGWTTDLRETRPVSG